MSSNTLVPYFFALCKTGALSKNQEKFISIKDQLEKKIKKCQETFDDASDQLALKVTPCIYQEVKAAMK